MGGEGALVGTKPQGEDASGREGHGGTPLLRALGVWLLAGVVSCDGGRGVRGSRSDAKGQQGEWQRQRTEARGRGGGQGETSAIGHTRDRWRASLRHRVCTRLGAIPVHRHPLSRPEGLRKVGRRVPRPAQHRAFAGAVGTQAGRA